MKFDFTEQEANLILTCLVKQPYEAVFQVVNKLQHQAQNQPEEVKVEPEKE